MDDRDIHDSQLCGVTVATSTEDDRDGFHWSKRDGCCVLIGQNNTESVIKIPKKQP